MNKLKSINGFVRDTFNMRSLILKLAKNDFESRYAGSYFGLVWGFIQPLVTILVYWFVFEKGLRVGSPVENVPFILWFMTGIVPWFYFSDALNSATGCLIEYSYLVKKVVFKVSVLPIVKLLSALIVHVFFVLLIFFVFCVYGYKPCIYNIQFIYYSFCMIILLLGVCWFTSAIYPFFKDLGQIINILLQFGMWLTPILWSADTLPANLQKIFKLNPLYYIVEGYRDTFINHVWFYHRYNQTIYFWMITIFMFFIGASVFKKLKPHFSDVL